jgi:hypothetical protein
MQSFAEKVGACDEHRRGVGVVVRHPGQLDGNHFMNLKMEGTRSNRDALGARMTVRAGGLSQIRDVFAMGSCLSHSDLRMNVGIGRAMWQRIPLLSFGKSRRLRLPARPSSRIEPEYP